MVGCKRWFLVLGMVSGEGIFWLVGCMGTTVLRRVGRVRYKVLGRVFVLLEVEDRRHCRGCTEERGGEDVEVWWREVVD